jgi:hypothetical protein
MSRHHTNDAITTIVIDRYIIEMFDLFIRIRPDSTIVRAPLDVRIGQGLCSTKWNGLNLFFIYLISVVYRVISVMNTYAWMQATADSRIVRMIGVNIVSMVTVGVVDMRNLPRSDMSKCPAIRLAVSRTHNVIGRIRFLVISMATMKNMSGGGVPCGRRCVSMCFVFLVHPNSTTGIQSVNDSGRVVVKWEVGEKICGYKAVKFIKIIVIKDSIIMFSVLFSVLLSENFTSFLNLVITVFVIFFILGEIFHMLVVTRIDERGIDSHDIFITDDLGSNIENKFVIILFVFWFFLLFLLFCVVCLKSPLD